MSTANGTLFSAIELPLHEFEHAVGADDANHFVVDVQYGNVAVSCDSDCAERRAGGIRLVDHDRIRRHYLADG